MATANDRIFYACQAVAITNRGNDAPVKADMVHGLQSVGITTNFNLEQAFELGQIEIYENIEGTPDVEVTLEKVLDGDPLIYHMATVGIDGTVGGSGLAGRSKARSDIRLGIFDDDNNNLLVGGEDAQSEVYCSGMYVSSVSYTLPVDGSSTESVTLVGINKTWLAQGAGYTNPKIASEDVEDFSGSDTPMAMGVVGAHSGGVQQREDVVLSGSILPASIFGVITTGYANGLNTSTNEPRIHLQNITVSTDFSREDILELGRKTPYARPAAFPIEVTCEIEAVTTSGDFVNAYEFGDPNLHGTISSGNNTSNEDIFIYTKGGYAFDLGSSNRLASVSYGGGDATGGNASCTYSYTNFNDLDVQNIKNGYCGHEHLKGAGTQKYGDLPPGARNQ